MKVKLVEVAWVDADHDAGWVSEIEDEEVLGYAYGLLRRKGKKFIFLAHQYDNGNWLGSFRIPKGMVRNIRVIEILER